MLVLNGVQVFHIGGCNYGAIQGSKKRSLLASSVSLAHLNRIATLEHTKGHCLLLHIIDANVCTHKNINTYCFFFLARKVSTADIQISSNVKKEAALPFITLFFLRR